MTDVAEAPVSPETAPPPPKGDPEAFALRGKPVRPIRFKRGVTIAISASASIGLVATAWFALGPSVFRVVQQQEVPADLSRASTEPLNDLPKTYSDVPKLGPPLPGDLGRPILEHQRLMASQTGQGDTAVGDARRAAAAARDRQLAEIKAARESGVIVKSTAPSPDGFATPVTGVAGPATAASKLAFGPERDPNGQSRKIDFVASVDRSDPTNPHSLRPPASPNMLSAGSVIAASLITGLRSDVPGLVTAQVTERVYDSATGRILLIPQGARLIGSYDSVVAFGQRRALVVWQRIILPDGQSLAIDHVPASDPAGYSGLADKVDFHTWSLLKGVALSTLLGVGSTLTFSGESDLVQAIRQSTQQNVARAGDQLTARNLEVQPTITIRPGAPVRLVVHRDLVLLPWQEDQ